LVAFSHFTETGDMCRNKSVNNVHQCFSTFLLQRNLPQMFALLMEPYALIQVSILLQPHRTVVVIFVPGKIGGTLGLCGNPV